jgi:hypothetical protein
VTAYGPDYIARVQDEIAAEEAYLCQGDGKDERRRAVVDLIMQIRGSDGYGGIGHRGAIQLCRAMEALFCEPRP